MRVLILGSGNIGSTIALFLHNSEDYEVCLASRHVKPNPLYRTLKIDVDKDDLESTLGEYKIVISALSYYQNVRVSKAALKTGVSYFDLTEDRVTTQEIINIGSKAKEGQVFMPQCGLAPGFIAILGYGLSRQFDEIRSIKMRVGALPLYPTNQLKYNLSCLS